MHWFLKDILFFCIGCIIGWGAFVLPGVYFLELGFINSIAGLSLGALFIVVIATNYFKLSQLFPQTGGEFLYTLRFFGKKHGFICGWFLVLAYLCIIPLNLTALSLLFDHLQFDYLQSNILYYVNNKPIYLNNIILSLFILVLVLYINLKGIKIALYVQNVLTVVILLSILFCIIGMSFSEISWKNLTTYILNQDVNLENILKVVAISPWLYIGFDCAMQIIQDVKHKNFLFFNKLVCVSIIIGCFIYILVLAIAAFSYPYPYFKNAIWVVGQGVKNYFGFYGLLILSLGVFCAILSGINGFFMATCKLIYSLSENNIIPKQFMWKNQYNSPVLACFFVAGISAILPFFGREYLLYVVDMSSIGIIISFIYISLINFKFFCSSFMDKTRSLFSLMLSSIFLLLLLFPNSPAALKYPSLIMLFFWMLLGAILIRKM
ncbi:APC family permease [Campylobacter lari]|uniref:APC family permease n=1 Tax=Campylobacter lari TaxID=201 RepID=UPI00215280B3|nr:APC family permease [Campylobacter lari]MCR6536030.1 APC family permease [Campylobacter lari]